MKTFKKSVSVFILFFFVVMAVVAGLSGEVCAQQQKITLTYANFPPASTFPCVQMEKWKEELEKRTNGAVEVQTFPGSTLLGAKDMYDGVVSGVADVGNLAMSYQPGRFPVSEAVDLPLGFSSAKAASMTLYDLIEKHQPKEFKDVKIITLFTCPPANMMTSTPVKKLDDLKGMELRVSGTGVDVIKALGGTPVAMPMSETPDAIQKGVVKGIVSSMEILKDFKFAAYCPNVTKQNLNVVSFAVVMNDERWNTLPREVQDVINEMSREHALWTAEYVDDHVDEALQWSRENHDLQIYDLPQEEQKQVPELLQPLIDKYVARVTGANVPGEQILEDVLALKEKYEAQFNPKEEKKVEGTEKAEE
jgi:TRAP-type transport system periplasmic protein